MNNHEILIGCDFKLDKKGFYTKEIFPFIIHASIDEKHIIVDVDDGTMNIKNYDDTMSNELYEVHQVLTLILKDSLLNIKSSLNLLKEQKRIWNPNGSHEK